MIRHPSVRRAPRPPFGLQKGLPTGPTVDWDSQAAQQLALDTMGAAGGTWWTRYAPTAEGLITPAGMEFIPQFTVIAELIPATILAACIEAGQNGWIIYLNEPEQLFISVADAVAGWNTLINNAHIKAFNIRLVSPTPLNTDGPAGTSQWFADWWAGIAALTPIRYPDAIALHRYSSAANIIARAAQYRDHYPGYQIWMTEFGPGVFISDADSENTMLTVYRAFVGATFVDRAAWFALGQAPSTFRNLANPDGSLTAIGTYWKNLSLATL